jgi:hypothetical protein
LVETASGFPFPDVVADVTVVVVRGFESSSSPPQLVTKVSDIATATAAIDADLIDSRYPFGYGG